jgi:chorismate synthase
MFKLIHITAGESHGKGLVGIIEGIPANLSLGHEFINEQLRRRQIGYGRGGRMKIESDRAEILSGVRWGMTMGSPIALHIENKDWENWQKGMSIMEEEKNSIPPVTKARPGHADLAGILKYHQGDIRNILERSSARETAMRVALGAIARRFLEEFNIEVGGFVTSIGAVEMSMNSYKLNEDDLQVLAKGADSSDVRCPDDGLSSEMRGEIDSAREKGYSLGGTFIVYAVGLPAGLGSHIQWGRKLDARLSYALMGIQAIKGVEIGDGFHISRKRGNEVMDEIYPSSATDFPNTFVRRTNHAGGIEGGISNGMPIIVKAAMKPIPTQRKPLRSVDIITGESVEAAYERSDVCAVPSAAVIAEAMTALVLADAFLEKFGGDSIGETKRNYEGYLSQK